jgi:hypothetical protein
MFCTDIALLIIYFSIYPIFDPINKTLGSLLCSLLEIGDCHNTGEDSTFLKISWTIGMELEAFSMFSMSYLLAHKLRI